MKKIVFLLLLFISTTAFSQKISNIDFDLIKTSLDRSPKLYDQLIERFKNSDTTLTKEEYHLLYYGQCYQKDYNPYGNDTKNFDSFKKYYQEKSYAKALPHALKMIDSNPMNMKMTFYSLVCYHYLKDTVNKAKMGVRYNNIIDAIFDSGDGKTASTAFVAMSVSDEYEIMGSLQVELASQSLIGDCDVMKLKENDLGIEKLYFNISKPFESMSKMFGK